MRAVLGFVLSLALAGTANAETRVIDGDTFELNGKVIRINGIDAPEHGQRCGDWNCGAAATDALAGLVEGKKVACITHGTDGYDRLIATCNADGIEIGQALVAQGIARAFLKYDDTYANAEQSAKAQALGLWSGPHQAPWEFRAERWEAAAQTVPEGCPIKGNITKNGRIYHAPWSPWYERTRINTAKGERWFCSEDEALNAGWRAPYWH